MTESGSLDRLKTQAESYFSRSSFSAPVFVGDDLIAFLDDRNGTPQVSVFDLADGAIRSITSFGERVQTLKGSASSTRMLFGMDDGGNERQQMWTIEGSSGQQPVRLTHASESIHEPGCLSKDGNYVLYRSNARDESTFDVLGMSLKGGEAEMWMQEGGQVNATDMHPDGDRILVQRVNGNMDSDLLLVTKGGEVTNLTPHDGEQWLFGAVFDAEGTGVWMLSNLERDYVALMHLNIRSGQRTVVYEADWDVEMFKVSPDGLHIALSVNEEGASKLSIIASSDGDSAVTLDVPLGVVDGFSWRPDSGQVAFGISTVENPSVIMVAANDGSTQVVADAAKESETEKPDTFSPELIHYPTWDGRSIPGFFFKPKGEGPFPVLVDVHGGPESQRRLNYTPSGPILQYFTSLGIAVLTLNVRGSTGYGKEYTHLDDKGLRLDSVKDVASSVEWLRSRPDVISDKIAVMGQSYGGFMTLASLVFHPELWTCAVDVVGIANFVSFLERTGPWRRKHRSAEYGDLEHDREMLERISPLNHIDNVEAPLLVIHGKNDPRVPLFEAEQVVEALQKRGREVELKVYDNEGHGLSKRPNRIDGYATAGAFLKRHLDVP